MHPRAAPTHEPLAWGAVLCAALVAAAALSCAGITTEPSPVPEATVPPIEGERAEPRPAPSEARSADARDEARRVLAQQLDGLRELDPGAFAWSYAEDAFVFGPFADEVLLGRYEARTAAVRDMDGKNASDLSLATMALRTGSSGPDVAWAMDDISVGLVGYPEPVLFRVASLLCREMSDLKIVAQSFAISFPEEVLRELVEADELVQPRAIEDRVGDGEAGLRQALEGLFSGASRAAPYASEDVFFSGPSPATAVKGRAEVADALTALRAGASTGGPSLELIGGVHARACPGAAFTAFHVQSRSRGERRTVPLRGFVAWETSGRTPAAVVATLAYAPASFF